MRFKEFGLNEEPARNLIVPDSTGKNHVVKGVKVTPGKSTALQNLLKNNPSLSDNAKSQIVKQIALNQNTPLPKGNLLKQIFNQIGKFFKTLNPLARLPGANLISGSTSLNQGEDAWIAAGKEIWDLDQKNGTDNWYEFSGVPKPKEKVDKPDYSQGNSYNFDDQFDFANNGKNLKPGDRVNIPGADGTTKQFVVTPDGKLSLPQPKEPETPTEPKKEPEKNPIITPKNPQPKVEPIKEPGKPDNDDEPQKKPTKPEEKPIITPKNPQPNKEPVKPGDKPDNDNEPGKTPKEKPDGRPWWYPEWLPWSPDKPKDTPGKEKDPWDEPENDPNWGTPTYPDKKPNEKPKPIVKPKPKPKPIVKPNEKPNPNQKPNPNIKPKPNEKPNPIVNPRIRNQPQVKPRLNPNSRNRPVTPRVPVRPRLPIPVIPPNNVLKPYDPKTDKDIIYKGKEAPKNTVDFKAIKTGAKGMADRLRNK